MPRQTAGGNPYGLDPKKKGSEGAPGPTAVLRCTSPAAIVTPPTFRQRNALSFPSGHGKGRARKEAGKRRGLSCPVTPSHFKEYITVPSTRPPADPLRGFCASWGTLAAVRTPVGPRGMRASTPPPHQGLITPRGINLLHAACPQPGLPFSFIHQECADSLLCNSPVLFFSYFHLWLLGLYVVGRSPIHTAS